MRLLRNKKELLKEIREQIVNDLKYGIEHDQVHSPISFEPSKQHYFNDQSNVYGSPRSVSIALPKELEGLSPVLIEYMHRVTTHSVMVAIEELLNNIYTDEEFERDLQLRS
jgi:hypothetical protein